MTTLPAFRALGIARRVAQMKQRRRRAEQKFTRTVNLRGRWHHKIDATPPARLARDETSRVSGPLFAVSAVPGDHP
jgi:hypothetical protein